MKIVSKSLIYTGLIASILLLGVFFDWLLEQIVSFLNLDVGRNIILITLGAVMFLGLAVLILSSKLSKKDKQAFTFFDVFERKKGTKPKQYDLSMSNVRNENKSILCMSGGGMKAGLFHLGGLRELNAQGVLSKINTFSSVSGGSITNAWLACNWKRLSFDETGIASNFEDVIFKPLFHYYTKVSVNTVDILSGLLPFSTVAKRLANSFDRNLFKGVKLSDFVNPQNGPKFHIVSTDLRTNTAWYFGRSETGPLTKNYKLGDISEDFTLGQVVAASAAFPPYLSPYILKLKNPMKPSPKLKELFERDAKLSENFASKLILGDGGIYDNLAVEKAKGHKVIYISNAGNPFRVVPDFPQNWASQFSAMATRVHRQVEQRRKIHFGDLSSLKQIEIRLWEIDDFMDEDAVSQFDGLEPLAAWKASIHKVRLSQTSDKMAKKIIKRKKLSREENFNYSNQKYYNVMHIVLN